LFKLNNVNMLILPAANDEMAMKKETLALTALNTIRRPGWPTSRAWSLMGVDGAKVTLVVGADGKFTGTSGA
jgi:hypothetical protein